MTLLVGHDSEFPLSRDGEILSALSHFGEFEIEQGRAFPDNMNCEIAINPVSTLDEFKSHTDALLGLVRSEGFEPVCTPMVRYDDRFLSHPDALVSGCNPDLSAYLRQENDAPDFAEMDGTRSCGAHIHLGYLDEPEYQNVDSFNLAKWMDLHLCLPLLKHEEKSDRRKLYGGPGCLRDKPYGIEYRTLSNVWLFDDDKREFIWAASHKALESASKMDFEDVADWWEVPIAIQEHDVEAAGRILDRLYIYGVETV